MIPRRNTNTRICNAYHDTIVLINTLQVTAPSLVISLRWITNSPLPGSVYPGHRDIRQTVLYFSFQFQIFLIEEGRRGSDGSFTTSEIRTGSMFHSILPASIFARSSTSLIRLVSRSPSEITTLRLPEICSIVLEVLGSDLSVIGIFFLPVFSL